MADNSILIPGSLDTEETTTPKELYAQSLERDNYLNEYQTEADKSIVRENLEIYPKSAVYTKDETDTNISQAVNTVMSNHLSIEDPHGTVSTVKEMITDMVKTDGSTPFTAPQAGIDPISDNQLTTKKFVTRLLNEHTKLTGADDPHKILPEVLTILEKYVKNSDVYTKSFVYTKDEIDKLSKAYIKKDGTTPFTKALLGIDPTIDSHLATKRYVDKTLYAHLVDVDPHGFMAILSKRLASYAKIANTYDKTQTYSRSLIDNLINQWVQNAVASAITEYTESINDKFESIRQDHYIKQDGSIPFRNPQAGVNATEPEHLVTLNQVNSLKTDLEEEISKCSWVTSGPVETTVGFVEDNTEVPSTMTFQEVCDAIFYGKSISISVPEYVAITEKCPITLCIHGSTALVRLAEVYQGDKLIYTFTGENFIDGCVTVDSEAILEDTTFTFKVTYTNGIVYEETATIKCSMPVFVGLLPKWKAGTTVTMEYLTQSCKEDTEGTLNRFVSYLDNLLSFSFKYKFEDAELRHPYIVIPKSYPDLESMITKSLSFGVEAFNVINDIPLTVEGVDKDIIFKIYIYKQALSSLNLEVTFNFKSV